MACSLNLLSWWCCLQFPCWQWVLRCFSLFGSCDISQGGIWYGWDGWISFSHTEHWWRLFWWRFTEAVIRGGESSGSCGMTCILVRQCSALSDPYCQFAWNSVCVSGNLRWNISEPREIGGWLLLGAYWKVTRGIRMMTSPTTSRDSITS